MKLVLAEFRHPVRMPGTAASESAVNLRLAAMARKFDLELDLENRIVIVTFLGVDRPSSKVEIPLENVISFQRFVAATDAEVGHGKAGPGRGVKAPSPEGHGAGGGPEPEKKHKPTMAERERSAL